MRFKHLALTSMPLRDVRALIMQEHAVPAAAGLRLFLGLGTMEENMLKTDDLDLSLDQLSINGGSMNDRVEQVGAT